MTRARWSPKRKLWFWGTTVAAVAALVITYIVVFAQPNYGDFDDKIDARCAPLVVIAFRGSGEGNLDASETGNTGTPHRYGGSRLVTNGWEGITLDGLFEALSTTVYEGFEADRIPVTPVGPAGASAGYGYNAIAAVTEASTIESALTYSSSKLLLSATRGAAAATQVMADYLREAAGCPVAPKFVVTGYSQGAMAARHTAELNPDSVIGIVDIGDPYQMPDGLGVRDEGRSGIGIIRWKADSAQGTALDGFYRARDLGSAICHSGDPICEFTPVEGLIKLALGNYGEHLSYYSDASPDEAPTDAREIAKLAHARWLLAQQAAARGESFSADEAAAAADAALRAVSLSYTGTPTLVSAGDVRGFAPGTRFAFDLDGDGTFETRSDDGLAWPTFDDAGEHRVTVRITPPGGETVEQSVTITVRPQADGDITFTPDGTLIDPSTRPSPTPTPEPTDEPTDEPTTTAISRPNPQPSPARTSIPPATPAPTPAPAPAPTAAPSATATPTTPPTENPRPQPSPTQVPTPEPTRTPAPTPDPTPTATPQPTPTPTAAPMPTPTSTPSPTPTTTPSPTPDPTPTPTPTPDPTPTTTPTPTPTQTPEPTYTPTLTLTPDSVEAGGGISIAGEGYAPEVEVAITSSAFDPVTVTTSSAGTISAEASVLTTAMPGEHPVIVTWTPPGAPATRSESYTVTVLPTESAHAPTLTFLPEPAAPGRGVMIRGEGFAPEVEVTIESDAFATIRDVTSSGGTLVGETMVFPSLPSGRYPVSVSWTPPGEPPRVDTYELSVLGGDEPPR